MEYAIQKKGHKPIDFFAFYIRGENNEILGGCNGENLYGCFFIGQLWVSEPLRGKGYGTKLMLAAEQLAKDRGCTFAAVNTMDWEALGFYKKLGYQVELERHGFLKNSVFYFLRKDFITLCDAKINDLDKINHLLRLSKGHWEYSKEFLDAFIEKFGITEEYLLNSTTKLFYFDEQLVGFYGFMLNEEGSFELDNFFIHPDYMGKGFGQELWYACCKTAKELGKNEFIIWCDPNSEAFYLKMGCQKIGVRQSPMMKDCCPAVLKFTMQTLTTTNAL